MCVAKPGFNPLPIWLIRVCAQIHDEVAPILCHYIAPLTLVLDDGDRHRRQCNGSNTCGSAVAKPSQDFLLSKYGRVVRKFQTFDFDHVQLRFDDISAYRSKKEKLVLDCTNSIWNDEDCIGPLKLDLGFCPRLCPGYLEGEVRETILAKYSKLVKEASMGDYHCDVVSLKGILRYYTTVEKVSVDAWDYEVEAEDF